MKKYTYIMKLRSPAPGAQPKGFIEHIEIEGAPYGAIVYNKPLNDKEIYNYDLKDITADLVRDEIRALLEGMIDFSAIDKIAKLEEMLKDVHFNKIITDHNIEKGVQVKRKNSIALISKGFKDGYRITEFDLNYQPFNHSDFKTIEELRNAAFKRYKLEILEIL